MKLLICTQALDRDDPILGFFHSWVLEFAKHFECVTVICLREGVHNLPNNVSVCSLGKEKGGSRLVRWWRALRYIVVLRKEYDVVFAHMNPEYVLIGGWFWRLMHKKTALWYMHKTVDLKLRIAVLFVQKVFTGSPESFRLSSSKVQVMGHGIDTDFFSPDPHIVRSEAMLSVGRLSKSKRHDLIIEAANIAHKELHIAGSGPEHAALEALAQKLGASVRFLGGLTQEQLLDEYRKAAVLVHTSETGSMYKVVLEALATDAAVITTSEVFKDLPVHLVDATSEAIAEALGHPRESWDRVNIIREKHSLPNLISRISVWYAH